MGGGGGLFTLPTLFPQLLKPEQDQWGALNPPDVSILIPFPSSPPSYDIYAEIFDTHVPDVSFLELVYTTGLAPKHGPAVPAGFGPNWSGSMEVRGPTGMGVIIKTSTPPVGHYILNAKRKIPVSPGTPIRFRLFDKSMLGMTYYALWIGVGSKDAWYWPRSQENSRFVAGKMPPPLDKALSRFQVEVTGVPGNPRYKIKESTSGLDLRDPEARRAAAAASSQPLVTSDRPPPPKMQSGTVFMGP